jgi:hypothetical protein
MSKLEGHTKLPQLRCRYEEHEKIGGKVRLILQKFSLSTKVRFGAAFDQFIILNYKI